MGDFTSVWLGSGPEALGAGAAGAGAGRGCMSVGSGRLRRGLSSHESAAARRKRRRFSPRCTSISATPLSLKISSSSLISSFVI